MEEEIVSIAYRPNRPAIGVAFPASEKMRCLFERKPSAINGFGRKSGHLSRGPRRSAPAQRGLLLCAGG
jgi:hypothetical protein